MWLPGCLTLGQTPFRNEGLLFLISGKNLLMAYSLRQEFAPVRSKFFPLRDAHSIRDLIRITPVED